MIIGSEKKNWIFSPTNKRKPKRFSTSWIVGYTEAIKDWMIEQWSWPWYWPISPSLIGNVGSWVRPFVMARRFSWLFSLIYVFSCLDSSSKYWIKVLDICSDMVGVSTYSLNSCLPLLSISHIFSWAPWKTNCSHFLREVFPV